MLTRLLLLLLLSLLYVTISIVLVTIAQESTTPVSSTWTTKGETTSSTTAKPLPVLSTPKAFISLSRVLADDSYKIRLWRNGTVAHYQLDGEDFGTDVIIEDVDFQPDGELLYFSVSDPQDKRGVWNASLAKEFKDAKRSHPFLRKESQPKKIAIVPKFNAFFLEDAGFNSVTTFNIQSITQHFTKSYFQSVEKIHNFYLTENSVIGLSSESGKVYNVSMIAEDSEENNKVIEDFPITDHSKILAFDSTNNTVVFCDNDGSVKRRSLLNSDEATASGLTCDGSIIIADDGFIYAISEADHSIIQIDNEMVKSNVPNANANFDHSTEKLISFKKFDFIPIAIDTTCLSCKGSSICLPNLQNEATCICADYFNQNASTGQCQSKPIEKPTLVVMEDFGDGFSTIARFFQGDPTEWLHRPRREKALRIHSEMLAIASDYNDGSMFAVENRYRRLFRFSSTDGSGRFTAFNEISPMIKTLSYDWVGNNVMWVDPAFHWLRIASLGGPIVTYKTVQIQHGFQGYSQCIDASAEGYTFFLDYEDENTTVSIYRTFLDGSDAKILSTFNSTYFNVSVEDFYQSTAPYPGALAVDWHERKLWLAFSNKIFKLNYDGQVQYSMTPDFGNFNTNNSGVTGLQVLNVDDKSFLFVTLTNVTNKNDSIMFVYSIDHSDGHLENEGNFSITNEFRGMVAHQPPPTGSVTSTNDCSKKRCSEMCTNVNGQATCLCGDGKVVSPFNDTLCSGIGFLLSSLRVGFTEQKVGSTCTWPQADRQTGRLALRHLGMHE